MAVFPDHWKDALKWYQNAMWEEYFLPTNAHRQSELLNMGFASGNLAFAHIHMWFAGCCMGDIDFNWDTAVMPTAPDGTTTAKMHADTYEIMRFTEHPNEAWEVVMYLSSPEVAEKLTLTYSVLPARISLQGTWFEKFNEKQFPGMDINWQVVSDSAGYADSPGHEQWLPSFQETVARYGEFYTLLIDNADVDIDAEIETLIADLQVIYDAAEE
jgi:multiple sugar transport system substrate-binding protein